ncbi:uncharacterized protein LOC108247979 [Kryptolebias marmoratus]|uniref:uncharacterized protein LOC108247979 n=1 Tax=Kryptolebias marmoratus TaxID=37003 RepID=UPI0018ACCCAA|nr:uncharacterized protein LOC108247979 [Kryptolebias marmoratus]
MKAAEHQSSSVCVFRMWLVVFVLATVGPGFCMNEIELVENYDYQIFQDQQEEDSPNPIYHADLSHWDKLFIALEDSQLRQNILLESVERCCGGMASLRSQVEMLLNGTFHQYAPSLVSACREQAEQATLRLLDILVELYKEGAERERRINTTLELILQSRYEENARLKRLEEAVTSPSAGSRSTLEIKSLPSDLKEQEMTPPENVDTMKGFLVAIEIELQRVYLQLSKMMEQAGVLTKGRGDT